MRNFIEMVTIGLILTFPFWAAHIFYALTGNMMEF